MLPLIADTTAATGTPDFGVFAQLADSHAPPVFALPKAPSPFSEVRDMSSPGKVFRVASN